MKLVKTIFFWFNCARAYSLPITLLSWLVIFLYTFKLGGEIFNGLLALVGISLVHMATNLIDDYFDYKILLKNESFFNSTQNCKCAYLKNKQATITELKLAIVIFLVIASIIGTVLFFLSGYYVAILALIALLIAIFYQKLSLHGLGEIAVIIAYGPLLFEGVYYVMTKTFSLNILALSIACALFTNTILYSHMLMDFDGDQCAHKTTLCRKLKTKSNALNFILIFYLTSFVFIGITAYLTKNYLYYITFLTIPMILDLYNSLKLYNKDKTQLHKIYPWHYPLDNWDNIKTTIDAPFYFNFYYSRNIMTTFMVLTCIAIIFQK